MAAVTHRFVDATDPSEIQGSENRLRRVDVLKRLLHAARFAHPGTKKPPRRQTATQFARCILHLETFRAWFGDPANPALQETLAQRPSLIMCAIHPYLNAAWGFEQKMKKLSEALRLLTVRL